MKTTYNNTLDDLKHLEKVWLGMICRTTYTENNVMNRYYEGIKVYPAWRKNPLAFCIWCLKHGWRQGLTIDRICNWYGYNPRNVRFVTRARNLANRKRKGHQGFRGRRNDLPMNIQQTPEGKYVAMFVRDGIRYRVGSFNTLIKASRKLETKIKQVEKAMYAH